MKIILFHSDPMKLILVSKILKFSPYETIFAKSQEEVIDILQRETCHAVIVEREKGLSDVFELRNAIRQFNPTIPMIFYTSFYDADSNAALSRIVEDPYSHYFPKPFHKDLLLNVLDQALSVSRQTAELQQMDDQLQSETFLASHLQRTMLPPYAELCPQYEYSVLYRPHDLLSRDFFDKITLSEKKHLFVLGNVFEHGIHSALAMVAQQSFLKSLEIDRADPIPALIRELNAFLWHRMHGLIKMRGQILLFDSESAKAYYFNAGCLEMIRINTVNGSVMKMNPGSERNIPFGAQETMPFHEEDIGEYTLGNHDVFLAGSHGLKWNISDNKDGDCSIGKNMFYKCLRSITDKKMLPTVAFPFQLFDKMEQSGYFFQHGDNSLFMLKKSDRLKNSVIYTNSFLSNPALCKHILGEVKKVIEEKAFSSVADNVVTVLQIHLKRIMDESSSVEGEDEDLIALNISASGKTLAMTVWDHGNEWRTTENTNKKFRTDSQIRKITSSVTRNVYSGLREYVFHFSLSASGGKRQKKQKKAVPEN